MNANTVARPGWWSRNWKWCVPVLAALAMAAFAAFVGAILALVFGAMRGSEPYRHGLERAQSDPAVVTALGEPITPGWFVQGSIGSNGGSGEADLAIPLDGPKASGTLYVVAEKRAGEWRYETLAVNVDGGERIVLESDDATPSPSRPSP